MMEDPIDLFTRYQTMFASVHKSEITGTVDQLIKLMEALAYRSVLKRFILDIRRKFNDHNDPETQEADNIFVQLFNKMYDQQHIFRVREMLLVLKAKIQALPLV